jgi:hypothetical protein
VQSIKLRHQFTAAQLDAVDRVEQKARRLLQLKPTNSIKGERHLGGKGKTEVTTSTSSQVEEQLDCACLDLSIALLDHELRGDIFESPVVGFMAALGVDARNQTYRDPAGYTGHLSGLVKISQMLVAQRAVQLAEDHHVKHPIRWGSLVFGEYQPFCMARAVGVNPSTSQKWTFFEPKSQPAFW